MLVISEVGGVQVSGNGSESWLNEIRRKIQGCPVEFDSSVSTPDVDTGSFLLPCHRIQFDYQIHLLENGAAVVIKDSMLYLCINVEGSPRVIPFTSNPRYLKLTDLF